MFYIQIIFEALSKSCNKKKNIHKPIYNRHNRERSETPFLPRTKLTALKDPNVLINRATLNFKTFAVFAATKLPVVKNWIYYYEH